VRQHHLREPARRVEAGFAGFATARCRYGFHGRPA
jgi:hypothetical protein